MSRPTTPLDMVHRRNELLDELDAAYSALPNLRIGTKAWLDAQRRIVATYNDLRSLGGAA